MTSLPAGATGTVLADGHGLGERFDSYTGVPDGWDTARHLLLGDGLDVRLRRFEAALGTDSPAVAAALLFEQYAQRLSAPVLAAFHRDRVLLDARPDAVLVSPPAPKQPLRMAFTEPATPTDDPSALRERLFGDGLFPVVEHLHRRTRVGRRTLRGAIANAVAVTYLHLSWPRPDHTHYVGAARALLEPDGLADLVGIEAVEVDDVPWMYTERNTCCLAFRTSRNREQEQPYCLTCPCLDRAITRSMFTEATASYVRRHPPGGTAGTPGTTRADAAGS